MPPRRTANQRCVAEEDELDRRIEQIIDIRLVVALERRLDVVVDRLGEKMGALMETRQEFDPRCGRVPNSTANLEEIEYDSNSEGDATLFSEEDPPDDAFFVAGGDGEVEYDEDGNPFHSDRVSKLSDNSFTRQVKRRNQDLPMRSFSFMPAYHIEDISYDEADSVFDIYPEEVIEFVFDDQGKPTFVANKFVLKDIGEEDGEGAHVRIYANHHQHGGLVVKPQAFHLNITSSNLTEDVELATIWVYYGMAVADP
ncbi:hypothetical protein CRG98_024796 [Punica granatum]|uniref:Uncharacterized protein n=1 Tax=Punica granatum TaxID=22663 RepID=A0A2I0JEV6_PUNGR|nr:hypothetical protein CRG98_024796 [Punica granatum]